MKLRRCVALLMAALLLVSALPLSASAAGYYARINGEQVSRKSYSIYGDDETLRLSEIEVTPHEDYYEEYDFFAPNSRGTDAGDYIKNPNTYYLAHEESVYLGLYETERDYDESNYAVLIRLTYSTQEFSFTTKPDSQYSLALSDFDPSGTYGLVDNLDGSLVVRSLPSAGVLYVGSTLLAAGDEVLLNDISKGKLNYYAPESSHITADSFGFSARTARGVTLIPESTMYISLTDAEATDTPVNAERTLSLEKDGSYVFELSDFDYYRSIYDVEDFAYVRITSLPDYGYIRYQDADIRTSTWIRLSDVENGKLSYTLDNDTDYSDTTVDQLIYEVYTDQRNVVYTGTLSMDLSLFSAAGYRYAVKTDTRGARTFRLADFDDPDGSWEAADLTDTSSRADGTVTIMSLPAYGSLTLDDSKVRTGDDIRLNDIRQGLLKYVPDSTTDSAPDSFEFLLSTAAGTRLDRDEMYIDRTAVRTGVVSYYEEDALVAWMTGETEYVFTLSDLDDPEASRSLEEYHDADDEDDDGYIEILSLPDSGELVLRSGRSTRVLDEDDVVMLDEIVSGDFEYHRDEDATAAYTSFTFRAYDFRGRVISADSVTVYIDFYETNPYAKGSYSYSVNKTTKTVQVTFSDLVVDSSTEGIVAGLTAGDLTDLAAEAGFTGGTLELAADVEGTDLDSRTITLDASLFTDSTKSAVFSTIRLVATDAGASSTGNAITNVCRLSIPVASVASLYVMSTADFSVTLERYTMTATDLSSLPNSTYRGGLARRVTFYVGNTKVNVPDVTLTLPYGKISSKTSAVVMMVQQSDGSFAPALSSSYNTTTYAVSGYCASGMVCTPYYRGEDSGMSFSDLTDLSVSWATSYIYYLAARDVVEGIGGGLFSPTASVTNAEFIKMLVGSLGLYDETATCSFTDIRGTSAEWAYGYVASAVKAGIVTDGTRFEPSEPIDRQTMALYAYRASLSTAADINLPTTYAAETFLDQSQIDAANREAVTAMQRAGIIQGDGTGHFAPGDTTTRAAAAKIICMLMQYKYN